MSPVHAPERPVRRGPRRPPEPSSESGRDAGPVYASVGAAAVEVAPQRLPAPRPRPEARSRHLRVVIPGERARRTFNLTTAVLVTATVFALLLAVAVAHTVLVQGQVRLDGLDGQLTQEQLHYQVLRKEVAALESPTRIVEAAHRQGMVTPDDLVYLQPSAPAPPSAGPAAGDDPEPAVDPARALGGPDRTWSEVKPLLEAPAP